MGEIKIMLDTLEKVRDFTDDAGKFEADMDVISGRTYVDAKSILGICSLVRNRPLTLKIYADDFQLKQVKNVMDKYSVH